MIFHTPPAFNMFIRGGGTCLNIAIGATSHAGSGYPPNIPTMRTNWTHRFVKLLISLQSDCEAHRWQCVFWRVTSGSQSRAAPGRHQRMSFLHRWMTTRPGEVRTVTNRDQILLARSPSCRSPTTQKYYRLSTLLASSLCSCIQAQSIHTLCPLYIVNNSIKIKPMSMIFGTIILGKFDTRHLKVWLHYVEKSNEVTFPHYYLCVLLICRSPLNKTTPTVSCNWITNVQTTDKCCKEKRTKPVSQSMLD